MKPILVALVSAVVMLLNLATARAADNATDNAADAADIVRGQRLFLQCRACHDVKAGASHKIGPNLHGTFGARAASTPGFAFSEALRQAGLVWDEATLDRWILRPADVVPGTTMAFIGIPSAQDRRALIEYLKVATR